MTLLYWLVLIDIGYSIYEPCIPTRAMEMILSALGIAGGIILIKEELDA